VTWCTLAGHQTHWITVGQYRVRVCKRCPHITTIITQQWPVPVNAEIGWTTSTEPPW
jgi:hypothetical protein